MEKNNENYLRPTELNINDYISESVVDGPGIRFTVFVQGCPHHCPGCHNPQTHDFNDGHIVDIQELLNCIKQNPLLSGITFSGGEPMCQPHPLGLLAKEIHKMGLNTMAYSGYTYEELIAMSKADPDLDSFLNEIDILVDGPFILEKRDLSLKFRGSSNQRILHLKNKQIVKEDF